MGATSTTFKTLGKASVIEQALPVEVAVEELLFDVDVLVGIMLVLLDVLALVFKEHPLAVVLLGVAELVLVIIGHPLITAEEET